MARRSCLAWSARDLVEEAEDGGDPAVLVGDRDIEADDLRLGPGRAKAPGEACLAMMRIDRPGESEDEAGKLSLHRADGRVDGIAAVRLGHRVDIAGVRGPDGVDQLAPGGGVGLVP